MKFCSLGKEYIKVYIDSVEQTDADISTISIAKSLNAPHTASFDLGRAYDASKPNMESVVEIRYYKGNWTDYWLLYKGYVTDILPTNSPESIRINCQDKYWKQNKSNNYFFVGHKAQDNKEKYYNTIQEALSTEHSFDIDIGNFIPQTISCFGQKESDCISSLIQNSGNYGWYYDENEEKKLWTAGQGDIVNLERQSIGTNLRLFQVIRHQFRESIDGIVNKLRVQMGEEIIREFDDYGGIKRYTGYRHALFHSKALPAWGASYEKLAKYSSDGYGVDHPEPGKEDRYNQVFRKFYLPTIDKEVEAWSDKYPPRVDFYAPGTFLTLPWGGVIFPGLTSFLSQTEEGFTIDYENRLLILSDKAYSYTKNTKGELTSVRALTVGLSLWKRDYFSYTATEAEDPESDISNPLMFFTDKMGDYSETILGFLDLSGLSIQIGGTYINPEGDNEIIPSWDDTEFAEDFADWQLSKTCDKKVTGSIDITLDAFCFYNIDLSKRIMIDGVIENPLNITSITLNLNSFLATVTLENSRYYKRTISLQTRGE